MLHKIARYQKLALIIALTVLLPTVYAHVVMLVPFSVWLSAAVFNSFISVCLLAKYYRQLVFRVSWYFYLPSALVLLGCVLALLISSPAPVREEGVIPLKQYLFIIWIPLIEEVVFRFGLGRWFRFTIGNLWGGYCAAVCFSYVHSFPTLAKVAAGDIGIVLSPLLLGFAGEYLLVKSKSILPGIALHMACNATVLLFLVFDQRWFTWLKIFYH